MTQMRAALYDRYGPPEVLYEGTVPKPVAQPGEVLVRVHASSVNGGELYGRAGKIRPVTGLLGGRGFPKRIGIDFTGEIAALGSPMPGLAVGDRVWGSSRMFGTTAEYLAVRPRRLSLAPAGLDLVQAAALPAGTTAITALRDEARLEPGERLLVRGAAGGVGSVAVQLGKAYGAHVTGTARAAQLDFVRDLGADEAFDYKTVTPAGLGRFDVILDTAGTDLTAYRRLLTRRGRMVAIAFDVDNVVPSLSAIVASGAHGSRRVRFFSGNPTHRLFADLTAYTESGAIRPVVDTVHPLSAIAEAHRALETGGVRGKLIISLL